MNGRNLLLLFSLFVVQFSPAAQDTNVTEDEGNEIPQPSFKKGFPPYNYTPTDTPEETSEDAKEIDYDIDAANPNVTESERVATPSTGEPTNNLWQTIKEYTAKQGSNKYVQYIGLLSALAILYLIGVWIGKRFY